MRLLESLLFLELFLWAFPVWMIDIFQDRAVICPCSLSGSTRLQDLDNYCGLPCIQNVSSLPRARDLTQVLFL